MTNQEMFDHCLAHLRVQRQRSHDNMGCMYRSPDGLKCAIGALIPNESYRNWFEGKTVQNRDVMKAAGIDLNQIVLANAIQTKMHDNLRNPLAFERDLENAAARIAEEYGLTYA